MPSRAILLAIGGLVFLAGLAVTLKPLPGRSDPPVNGTTVSCRAPVFSVGLEDVRIRLAALERLSSGQTSDRLRAVRTLLRLAELERAGEEYRACKKRGATRMRIGGLLEAVGIVVVVFVLLERVIERDRPSSLRRSAGPVPRKTHQRPGAGPDVALGTSCCWRASPSWLEWRTTSWSFTTTRRSSDAGDYARAGDELRRRRRALQPVPVRRGCQPSPPPSDRRSTPCSSVRCTGSSAPTCSSPRS